MKSFITSRPGFRVEEQTMFFFCCIFILNSGILLKLVNIPAGILSDATLMIISVDLSPLCPTFISFRNFLT